MQKMHKFIPNFHLGQSFPECPVASYILPRHFRKNHGENIFPYFLLRLSYSYALMKHEPLEFYHTSLTDSHPKIKFWNKIKKLQLVISPFPNFACKFFDTCIIANLKYNYIIKLWLTSTLSSFIPLNNTSRCRREQYSYSALVLFGVFSRLSSWRSSHNGLFEHGSDSSRSLVACMHCSNQSFCCSWEMKTFWNEYM